MIKISSLPVSDPSEIKPLALCNSQLSFVKRRAGAELHSPILGTGNALYYTAHLFVCFHEENNFQNKSKADAEIRMILEQSVTWRRYERNSPIYTDVGTIEQGKAPPTSHSPTRARHPACGQSCGSPGLQTQGRGHSLPSQCYPSITRRGLDLTSQTPRLSSMR